MATRPASEAVSGCGSSPPQKKHDADSELKTAPTHASFPSLMDQLCGESQAVPGDLGAPRSPKTSASSSAVQKAPELVSPLEVQLASLMAGVERLVQAQTAQSMRQDQLTQVCAHLPEQLAKTSIPPFPTPQLVHDAPLLAPAPLSTPAASAAEAMLP